MNQPSVTSPSSSYIKFMKYKWLYFAISFLVVIPGIFSLVKYGLRLSIDFTGGSLIEIETRQSVSSDQISAVVSAQKFQIASIQSSENKVYLLRLKHLDQDQKDQIISALNKDLEGVVERRFESVGPVIGAELAQKALLAIAFASICIVIYVAWSFRKIPHPYSSWKFGISAVFALIHDVLVVAGIFSLLGHFFAVEVDALFVTAILTVIGFSVHDTIVVFDRVRENLPKLSKSSFEQVVDFSLTETIARSLNTSFTVILILTALLLFGGQTIRWFVVALLIGIISGTFSSIFNASPILVLWENYKKK